MQAPEYRAPHLEIQGSCIQKLLNGARASKSGRTDRRAVLNAIQGFQWLKLKSKGQSYFGYGGPLWGGDKSGAAPGLARAGRCVISRAFLAGPIV